MTAAEFKKKWSRYKESAAYQEHFNDLCRLLGQPTPAEAYPSGSDFFCFQSRRAGFAEAGGEGRVSARQPRGQPLSLTLLLRILQGLNSCPFLWHVQCSLTKSATAMPELRLKS